jgi:hypothetical protein
MDRQKLLVNCCILLFGLALSVSKAPAQSVSAPAQNAPALAQDAPAPDPDSRLYNGHEYIRNGIHAKGFAFFIADSLQNGTLIYDGIRYGNIPLQYDLVLDELIVPDYNGKALLSLIPEKVDQFVIANHHFEYIPTGASNAKPGFYEVLCSGHDSITLLGRHEKRLIFASNQEETARYNSYDYYFLRIGNTLHSVNDESALLNLLKEKKPALKKYIRENNLRFKKDPEDALIRTVTYYLTLTN